MQCGSWKLRSRILKAMFDDRHLPSFVVVGATRHPALLWCKDPTLPKNKNNENDRTPSCVCVYREARYLVERQVVYSPPPSQFFSCCVSKKYVADVLLAPTWVPRTLSLLKNRTTPVATFCAKWAPPSVVNSIWSLPLTYFIPTRSVTHKFSFSRFRQSTDSSRELLKTHATQP